MEGYNLYCSDLTQNTKGVIIYVDNGLKSSEINFEVSFNENIFVRINSDTVIGNIYRSSTDENDIKLYELVDTLSKQCNNFILTGDFNFSDIQWSDWTSATNSPSSLKFINKMQANLLMQHVDTSTRARARGMDTPHILDLVITNTDIINSIDYLAPFGKSDHSVLITTTVLSYSTIDCRPTLNYNKGEYDELS